MRIDLLSRTAIRLARRGVVPALVLALVVPVGAGAAGAPAPAADRAGTPSSARAKAPGAAAAGPVEVPRVRSALSTAAEPGDAALARDGLRRDLTRENFYFVMTDRFANGDRSNDRGGRTGDRVSTGYDPADQGYYHGGDLRGLIRRLDYIRGMGTSAIWLTPTFKNRTVQPAEPGAFTAGYHGYWITDFTQIDPHLGTNDEMRELVDKAHARGMKVFFDIITNHTADVIDYAEKTYTYRSKGAYPYLDRSGREFDDSDYAGTGRFPRVDLDSFPYTPVFPKPSDATVKVPAWLNDRTMYHNRGNTDFSLGEIGEYGDFVGLDDLWTERPKVVDGLVDIYQTWVREAGVDGFRIDTVKHVNMEFWQRFGPSVKGYATRLGNRDFFMFGEVFNDDPAFVSRYTTEGRLQSALDFPFQGRARAFASQSLGTNRLRDLFAADDYYTDADSNAYSLPTFLGNHDMGRIGFFVTQDNAGATEDELLARDRLAHELMYFSRGMPVVYYGDEQGFTGAGGDKSARQDMFASRTPEYLDDNLLGTDRTHAEASFDRSHPLYASVRALADLTRRHPALRDGAQVHRLSGEEAGVYAFSRIDARQQVEYVVALNNAENDQSVAVPTYSPGMTFDRLYPEAGDPVVSAADARVQIDVPALSAVVLRARARLAVPASGPAVAIVAPPADSDVRGRFEVSAEVPGGGFNQVTFAAKVGDADWRVLGTDDNAPYRVFPDLTGVAAGTPVAFKAVVKDSAGRIASARSDARVGEEPPPGAGGPRDYLVVHYQRSAADYDGWGLYAFGGIDPGEVTEWPANHPFHGEDSYGRFAWVKLAPGATDVGFLVNNGDAKDCDQDRHVNPQVTPEIWVKQGSCEIFTSQAAAQGYVTFNYTRPDGDYTGWGIYAFNDVDEADKTVWPANNPFDTETAYGRSVRIRITPGATNVGYIVQNGLPNGTKDCDADRFLDPTQTAEVWLRSGTCDVFTTEAAARGEAVIHYHRPDGDYGNPDSANYNDFWGLHVWDGAATPTEWTAPLKPAGRDAYGLVFRVPLAEGATGLNYILHRGDTKDLPEDQRLDLATFGNEVWVLAGTPGYLLPMVGAAAPDADLSQSRAQWIDRSTVVWDRPTTSGRFYSLRYSSDGSIEVEDGVLTGGRTLRLIARPEGLTPEQQARWPHLAGKEVFTVDPRDLDRVRDAVRGQVVALERDGTGRLLAATGVQTPGVLDDLFAPRATRAKLGPTWAGRTPTLAVWAPTARDVDLKVYADARPGTRPRVVQMRRDPASGVWSVTGSPAWKNRYYLYSVRVWSPSAQAMVTNDVTDPYSLSLSTNSTRSQVVDLRDRALEPRGWDRLAKPAYSIPERSALYELHVRDFSISDETVRAAYRGTFLAFTQRNSAGMRHLRSLARAGLTSVHLLPAFDIATIEEVRARQATPPCDLEALPPDSEEQQACIAQVADRDGFNWGYDPFHYTAPEGSYATDPQGTPRVRQFREMVAGLNRTGLRVVMDVVYNHTPAAGQDPKSVLDKVVPGYYHRLDEAGAVATSTCCANTAPEHAMMGKLVVDSVLTWARDYKVDGFRFDLMGHHPKANMLAVRRALDSLTLARDGVDGRKVYVYGEGWNFGEVANDARFEQATQANMAGTGIGTFNDRLRDAVRGGGPFDENPRVQGFGSGLFTDPNGDPVNGTADEARARLLHYQDLIKVGLTGNLAGYSFVGSSGETVTGSEVDYNGSPAGYTADPSEAITYVSAHDNETLYDSNAFKLPQTTAPDERARMQVLGLATVALGQGVAFFHAGSEILRSKSLDRNSYNSGDWFNRLNWDCTEGNNFGVGLPPAADNASKWSSMRPLLADPALRAGCAQMRASATGVRDLLTMRRSSRLFTLGTAAEIQEKLSFPTSGASETPGVVTMHLSDKVGRDVDPRFESVTVVFNGGDEAATQTVTAMRGADGVTLHPVQQRGRDAVVRQSSFDPSTGTFTVPARSVAVFVEPL